MKYIDELIREAFVPDTDREKYLLDIINKLEAEIEEQDRVILNALKRMGEIREETARELAEQLKEEITELYHSSKLSVQVAVEIKDRIDGLVKERVGESND